MGDRSVNVDVRRLLPRLAVGLLVFCALLYIIVLANPSPDIGGNWRTTTFGSAFDDWRSFVRTLLNGFTFAGLLFIVASGFSLIFGLMRVVNMAHGSFYLLGGYIAYEVQQKMTGSGFTIGGTDVNTWEWIFPALVAGAIFGAVGLAVQQAFLRWNQGQELRQALITIAISIILADQMLAHFGGVAEDIAWPRDFDKFVNLRVQGIQYTETRLIILAIAVAIGGALWLWLKRTRTGMVIRAGVDDRAMVSALGINIQLTFAIAFAVGSGLAGLGGVIGGSFAGRAPGVDAN